MAQLELCRPGALGQPPNGVTPHQTCMAMPLGAARGAGKLTDLLIEGGDEK